MALPINIPLYISYAKIAQYLWANDNSKAAIFGNGPISPQYARLIYMVRKSIEWDYTNYPTDSTLTKTGDYLWSLIGKYQVQAASIYSGSGCVAPVIVASPLTQTVGAGGTVTFVTVATGTNLSYQWRFNGANISSANAASYSIINLDSGDQGDYDCVVTNACGMAITLEATLTVGAGDIIGYYYFGDTDYFADLDAGTDNVPYVATFPIVNGQDLSVPITDLQADNMYNVIKYPSSQGIKTTYDNHTPNIGSIPGPNYQEVVVIGSWNYLISRVAMSLNSSFPILFKA